MTTLTQAQQAYMERSTQVSGDYTRAQGNYYKARREYRKQPSEDNKARLEKAITILSQATKAYYS